jgi:hypothetical protein
MTASRATRLIEVAWIVGAVIVLLGTLSCQPRQELEPAGETVTTPEDDTAQTVSHGVTMKVDGDAWTGGGGVVEALTPVYVTITNNSGQPLSLRYSNFALLGAWDRYAVLPPFAVELVDYEPVLVDDTIVIEDPEFIYDDLYVTPYHDPIYPDVDPYDDDVVFDAAYYQRYLTVWDAMELPNDEMLAWALPEGVLPDGGEITGFLYFEPLADGEEAVELFAELENAATNDLFGAINISYEVEGPLEP